MKAREVDSIPCDKSEQPTIISLIPCDNTDDKI